MNNKSRLLELLLTFMKIGLFTFGGGLAMISMINREVIENKKWMEEDELSNIIVIAESTPGPVAINIATFAGYRVCGVVGACAATFGVIVPSFIIILLISTLFNEYSDVKIVADAFWGIRIGVLALIVDASVKLFKRCPKNKASLLVIMLTFVLVLIGKVNIFFIMFGFAVIGAVWELVVIRRGKQNGLH